MPDRLAGPLHSLLQRIDSVTIDVLQDRVPLWSTVDDRTVVAKDGTLSSMIAIEGIGRELGRNDLRNQASRFHILLSPILADGVHSLELVYVRCRGRGIHQRISPGERAAAQARVLGLDLADLIAGRGWVQCETMTTETTLLSVYTAPIMTDPGPSRSAAGAARQDATECSNNPLVLARHKTAMASLYRDLIRLGYPSTHLEARAYINEVAGGLYPLLPRADRSLTGGEQGIDSLLTPEPVRILDSGTLATPASIISGFDVTLAPERLLPFNDLVATLASVLPGISWRCAFKFHANGVRRHRLREQFVRLFAFTNREQHHRMRAAYDHLREIDGLSDTVIQLQICFALWSPIDHATRHLETLWTFRKTVEQWGNCRVDSLTGDPVSTMLASVPGLAAGATAPAAAAPLTDALRMAPIARPCSPWTEGESLLRTPDGREWPYQRGSAVQNSWVEILVGNSGTGKSVALNYFNLASILDGRTQSAGPPIIPRVSVIDIGGSSRALVDVIREGLPRERQHEAVHIKLKPLPEFAINVFDTPLGCRRPTASGREFLLNFLSILLDQAGDANRGPVTGMIGGIVDLAYSQAADPCAPKCYSHGELAAVDHALEQSGFAAADDTTWWQVTDWLFAAGHHQLARLAQTRAVPTLPDLLIASTTHQIRITYGTDGQEEDPDNPVHHFRRAISEIVRDLPTLGLATRFGVDGARVVVIDLEEVSSGTRDARAERQTAVMAMLARHVIMRDRDIDSDDIASLSDSDALPSQFAAMHRDAVAAMAVQPQQLCMDEFHRLGAIEGVRRQVLQDMREGRKRNLRLSLASQYIEDFADGLLESASALFVFNTPSPDALARLARLHSLSDHEQRVLSSGLTGPGPSGAPLVGLFTTKTGPVVQKLILTLSPVELWALTSTAEDVHLRTLMYQNIDSRKARQILARRFPTGSAKREIDRGVSRHQSEFGTLRKAHPGLYEALVEDLLRDRQQP